MTIIIIKHFYRLFPVTIKNNLEGKVHTYLLLTEMTFPRADKDLLILAPSFSRSPVAPVLSARSDPDLQ